MTPAPARTTAPLPQPQPQPPSEGTEGWHIEQGRNYHRLAGSYYTQALALSDAGHREQAKPYQRLADEAWTRVFEHWVKSRDAKEAKGKAAADELEKINGIRSQMEQLDISREKRDKPEKQAGEGDARRVQGDVKREAFEFRDCTSRMVDAICNLCGIR